MTTSAIVAFAMLVNVEVAQRSESSENYSHKRAHECNIGKMMYHLQCIKCGYSWWDDYNWSFCRKFAWGGCGGKTKLLSIQSM